MKNKIYNISSIIEIVEIVGLSCYFLNTLRRNHALSLCIDQSEYISFADVKREIIDEIHKISPKCVIKLINTEINHGAVRILVTNMTKKERIQLKSIIPYWNDVRIG